MLQCWQVGYLVAKEGACPRGGPGRRLLGSLGVSGSSLASRPYLSDPQWPSSPAREAREAPGSKAEVPKALIWSPSHAACPACPVCSCCNSLFLSLHFSWHDLIGTEFSDPKPNPAFPLRPHTLLQVVIMHSATVAALGDLTKANDEHVFMECCLRYLYGRVMNIVVRTW